jgi:hypothetical protein
VDRGAGPVRPCGAGVAASDSALMGGASSLRACTWLSDWCRRRAVLVPHWREGLTTDVYRDIVEVVADAVGPMPAKQIVPRIGLPAVTAKIGGTRGKPKRLVERGRLIELTLRRTGNRRTPRKTKALPSDFGGTTPNRSRSKKGR